MAHFDVTTRVQVRRLQDLLCSALEGGSNYWYMIHEEVKPSAMPDRVDEARVYPHIDYPTNPGGALLIGDREDPKDPPKRLDLPAIQRGIQVMAEKYPKHFGDFMNENDDATTGDVFLQCCLFGQLVYG